MDIEGAAAPVGADEAPQASKPPEKPRELHPEGSHRGSKPLPTIRIAFNKQLDLLRAYGAASGIERKPVSLTKAAEMVGLAPATTSLANGFFVDARLLQKVEGPQPQFIPSQAVLDFAAAHQWKADAPAAKLGPLLTDTWAYQALEPRLRYSGDIPENQAIQLLAEACGATTDYRPNLLIILQYLEAAGLLTRDGQTVRRIDRAAVGAMPEPQGEVTTPNVTIVERTTRRDGGSGGPGRTEGQIRFAISFNIDVAELRGWSADRIATLFEGISKVIAANGGEDGNDGAE